MIVFLTLCYIAVLAVLVKLGAIKLNLWWKPFVTFIWYGGLLIALGGALALLGRVIDDVRRRTAARRIAERRADGVVT